jgi:hypothetical protein
MKKTAAVLLLFVAPLQSFAGTQEAYAIGFGAGIAFKLIPWTNHHVALPIQHKVQRTIRPVEPQDSQEKAAKKAEKERRKAAKQRHEQP